MRIFIYIVFTSFAAKTILAQVSGNSKEEPLPEYSFSVVYLSYQNSEIDTKRIPGINVKFRSDDQIISLSVRESSISRTFVYRGIDPLVFFKEVISPEGEVVFRPLVNVKLGDPGRKLITLVRNEAGSLQAYYFDMREEAFLPGTIRLVNFSKHPVRAKLGQDNAEIQPFKMHDYKVDGKTKKFLCALILGAYDEQGFYIIERRRLVATKGGRKLLFVYPDPQNPDRVTYANYRFEGISEHGNISDQEIEEIDFEAQRLNDRRMSREGNVSPEQ